MRRTAALLGGTTTWGDCAAAIRFVARPKALVQGDEIRAYEREFAGAIGVRHAFSFSAARVGFYGLLRAQGVGPGDEVLVPLPTHMVVANAVRYTGATPVFVDCRLSDYNVDLDEAEKSITARTKAIVVQHTFGIPVDLDRALELARRHGLSLIEDCVHALGATYKGRMIGSFGQAAFFSTEETKIISSTMGGMLVTDDPELAERLARFQESCEWPPRRLVVKYLLKLLVYHALTEPRVHRVARPLYDALGGPNPLPRPTSAEEMRGLRPRGYERRLSNAQAAIALRQLRRLDENVAHRRRIASVYERRLAERGFRVPDRETLEGGAFVRFPVWADDREAAVAAAAPSAVLGQWFSSVLNESRDPADAGYAAGSCPNAEAAAGHLVNLPTHLRVRSEDAEGIAQLISAPSERRRRVSTERRPQSAPGPGGGAPGGSEA